MKKANVKFIEQKRNNMYYYYNDTKYGVDVNGGLVNENGYTYGPYCKLQHTEETKKIQEILSAKMVIDWYSGIGIAPKHSPILYFCQKRKYKQIVDMYIK